MTNREWMNTLTDEELSLFLTSGLTLHHKALENVEGIATTEYITNISCVYRRSIQSTRYLEKWLSDEQEFETVRWNE